MKHRQPPGQFVTQWKVEVSYEVLWSKSRSGQYKVLEHSYPGKETISTSGTEILQTVGEDLDHSEDHDEGHGDGEARGDTLDFTGTQLPQ